MSRTQPAVGWGRLPRRPALSERVVHDRGAPLCVVPGRSVLAHGLGRSYSDVALNEAGDLLRTRGLDRFIAFDAQSGVLQAEAGVSLGEIVDLVAPRGWFPAVITGTRHVTLGGAVANDVHGKNHHRVGSFGHHVLALELLRSDGSRLECRRTQHADWLCATIGGLGLTGLITWVEIQLARIAQPALLVSNRRFSRFDTFWALDADLGVKHSHSVGWIDCSQSGRGIYSSADFAGPEPALAPWRPKRWRVPFDPPCSLINRVSVRAFNAAYFHRPLPRQSVVPAMAYLCPLDGVAGWNRLYGRRGFFQYQCVLPPGCAREAANALLQCLAKHRTVSCLAVVKTFGTQPPAGMLSFARAGTTLSVDVANGGDATLRCFADLDVIVAQAGGALYPAKDARMPGWIFKQGFPHWQEFLAYVDPAFSSTFWRRVMA